MGVVGGTGRWCCLTQYFWSCQVTERAAYASGGPLYTARMGFVERFLALIRPMGGTSLARPRIVDWILGAILLATAIAEVLFGSLPGAGPSAAVGLIASIAFVVRRVWPLYAILALGVATVAVDVVAGLTDSPIESTFAAAVAGLVLLYTAGRWAPPKSVAIATVIAIAVLPLASALNPAYSSSVTLTIVDALMQTVIVGAGLLVRSLADAREQRELAMALQERNRLANDIHDSFAHHMSAIAIRAEAARQLDDREELDKALRAIKQSASTGLADLRHFVAGFRDPEEIPRPLPGFGDLEHLASELSTDTVQVVVDIDAEPEMIPVSVSATAFWITREALTNILRHATSATRAEVRTRSTDHHLDLTITDDGATPSTQKAAQGHGLSSMTARARALGGELTAGPNPNGGWLVAARLPLNRGDS